MSNLLLDNGFPKPQPPFTILRCNIQSIQHLHINQSHRSISSLYVLYI